MSTMTERRQVLVELAGEILRQAMRGESRAAIDKRLAQLSRSVDFELCKQKTLSEPLSKRWGSIDRRALPREADLRNCALHEAAHAVYGIRRGLRIVDARIEADGSGAVTWRDRDRTDFASEIMFRNAGSIAAAMLGRKSHRDAALSGSSADDRDIAQLIEKLDGVWKIGAGDATMLEFFDDRAAKFVVRNRAAILAVAERLFDKRVMTGAEVKRIAESFPEQT
jgi:hypothetical protein